MTTPAAHALYTAAQVRALDAQAIGTLDIAGDELMRRAAHAALDVLRRRWPQAWHVCVVCGPGNNGGDGFLLAKLAREAGMQVDVVALTPQSSGDAAHARQAWLDAGGQVHDAQAFDALPAPDVYVDGLFGSGLARPLQGAAATLVGNINVSGRPVLALDVPSGLDADTGHAAGAVVHAAATVSFVAWKRGLFTGQAPDCCGELSLHTLGLPADLLTAQAPDAQLLQAQALQPRPIVSHKGMYGHVLVIGGDHGFGGAPRMAGEAALRVGAGLVSVATRGAHVGALLAARPELMTHAVETAAALAPPLRRATVLALGPGLGQDDWGRALWEAGMAAAQPLLLDADGLNLLARSPRDFAGRPVVLTPHPGEAARLLGNDIAAVQADRFAAARELARRHAAVVVLKGAGTLVAAPDGRVAVCRWGNPGLASGGTGDVLSGVIAGLLAQRLSPWRAACLGVGLHARAGDRAACAGQRGLLASDLFAPLHALVNGIDD